MDASPVLELARRADTADPVLWVKASGKGAIIVSAYASLFSNGVIGKADNARLLSNIVAWSLQPGGRVIFDDAHQGAMNEYDAAKFFADPRLHHTLLVAACALWLAWVVAAQPLRAFGAQCAARLDESAMLRVTARFFASVLRPVASAQWLLDEFFDRLRRRHGLLQAAAPPWDWLAAQAGVGSARARRAARLLRAYPGRPARQSRPIAADSFADFRTYFMTNALQDLEPTLQQRIGEVVLGVSPGRARVVYRGGRARPCAGAGRAGPGQDPAQQVPCRGAGRQVQTHPGHLGPDAHGHHRHPSV